MKFTAVNEGGSKCPCGKEDGMHENVDLADDNDLEKDNINQPDYSDM